MVTNSTTTSSSQGFPQISSPLVNPPTGILTSQWYNFFANLWTRSGISQGGTLVPSGQVVAFAGPIGSIPDGWIYCNGTAISQATYASLFTAIGTTYGGNGNTTFNVPDLRGKVLIGSSPSIPFGSSASLGHSGNVTPLPQYSAINYMIKT